MFLPLGDEVRKTQFPIVVTLLIVAHTAVFFCFRGTDPGLTEYHTSEVCQQWGISSDVIISDRYEQLASYWVFNTTILGLLTNISALLIFGPTLENRAGRILFLIIYCSAGMAAGYAYCKSGGNVMPRVGSEGAVAGLIGAYGVLVGMQTKVRSIFFWGMADVPAAVVVGLWLVGQYSLSLYSFSNVPMSSWLVVIPGLIAGFTLGFIAIPIAENEVKELRGEKWIAPKEEVGRNSQGGAREKLNAPSRPSAKASATRCPCCFADLSDVIEENAEANFYFCKNEKCKRLVFKSSLTT